MHFFMAFLPVPALCAARHNFTSVNVRQGMVVPAEYKGVWRRTLFSGKDGFKDTKTKVFWLQTDELYGDLRVPEPTPCPDCASLNDATETQLQQLNTQWGFAGTARVEGNICTWAHEVDFKPGGSEDIGVMTFSDPSNLREDATDGSYHELWERVPGSEGPTWGFRLSGEGQSGMLLGAGEFFLFVASQKPGQDQVSRLSCEISFGKTESWNIDLSTLPGRVGHALLTPEVTIEALEGMKKDGKTLSVGVYEPQGGWVAQ